MPAMKTTRKIAVLGAGKIGQTLVAGILDAGLAARRDVTVVTKHAETLDRVKRKFRVRGTLSCADAVKAADVVLLSVKPQSIREVLAEIDAVVNPGKLVITTVASVPTGF